MTMKAFRVAWNEPREHQFRNNQTSRTSAYCKAKVIKRSTEAFLPPFARREWRRRVEGRSSQGSSQEDIYIWSQFCPDPTTITVRFWLQRHPSQPPSLGGALAAITRKGGRGLSAPPQRVRAGFAPDPPLHRRAHVEQGLVEQIQ